MKFIEILKQCKGEKVVINSNEERTLIDVEEDFIILSGGNPQMKITDFIPANQIVKVIRADYTTGDHSFTLDLTLSGGDQRRSSMH